MASTGVVGYVLKDQDGKMKVIIGSVGDSRAYIQTKDGILKQVTIDDNNVREKFKDDEKGARSMQEKLSNIETQLQFNSLTEDEQNLFKGRRNITQAIGHEENVAPNIYAQDFQEEDRLIFLTDGISDNLTDKEINKIISESKNSQEATDKLIEAASKRSKESGNVRSKKDDMSAIVVGISEAAKKEPEPKVESNTSQTPSSQITTETPKDSVAQKTEVPEPKPEPEQKHQEPKPVNKEQEKEIFKQEAPVAVKFIKDLKEGKLGLDEALVYFDKLSRLREGNKQNFENFIFYEMSAEIGKVRPENAGKVNANEKERAWIIDSLIGKAKQESGDDLKKQEEYKQKIKDVFKVFSLTDNYGYYVREGNKDNIDWLGISSAKTS